MNYINILDCDIADGEGVRVTLFVSGCSHHCKDCQNPDSWNPETGKPFNQKAKQKLLELLSRDYIDGLTLSGGDPLFSPNRECITQLCKEVKEKFPNKTIWLYTGYEYKDIKSLEVLNYIDILVDGEFQIDKRDITLPFRGSTNQSIIYIEH